LIAGWTRGFLALSLAWLVTGWPAGVDAEMVRRVVSLNLCTDQWLVLLAPEKVAGLSPLARDPALSYVAARAALLPSVRASAEAVMDLHPDLVLGGRFGAGTTLALLERAGLRVERLDLPTDFAGIRTAIRAAAALLEVPDRAALLVATMDAALAEPKLSGEAPMTALVWQPRGWTSGPGELMDAVVRVAGMVNAGTGGRVGLEALLRRPPSLLVISEAMAGDSLATEMLRHPAVRGIPVREIPTPLTICPIPFTADAVALLARR
jgi:iron complex transport system substrate-binding protein